MKKIVALFFTVCAFAQSMCGDINWSSPVTISTTNVTASDPRIVIDTNNNATAVWIETTSFERVRYPMVGAECSDHYIEYGCVITHARD